VRDHLIYFGFKEEYIRWVRHGEHTKSLNVEIVENIQNIVRHKNDNIDDLNLDNDVLDESGGENLKNTKNMKNIENYQLNEMMNDVVADFVDIRKIFEHLSNDSNVPLYSNCTKFMKIYIIFKLYNLKVKINEVIKILPPYSNF
jgi:hypothetical protein